MVAVALRISTVLLPALLSDQRPVMRLVSTAFGATSLCPACHQEAPGIEATIPEASQAVITTMNQILLRCRSHLVSPVPRQAIEADAILKVPVVQCRLH